jgi:hypothetical protein
MLLNGSVWEGMMIRVSSPLAFSHSVSVTIKEAVI